jgi:hypothetical protein
MFNQKQSFIMHNLKSNSDKILNITKSFYKGSIDADDNYNFYPNIPKMSDHEIITLSIVSEAIGTDSENYLFGKIKSDYIHDFPNLIDSIPIPICKNAGINRGKICKDNYETAPYRGYPAVIMLQYINYQNEKPLYHLKYALVSL